MLKKTPHLDTLLESMRLHGVTDDIDGKLAKAVKAIKFHAKPATLTIKVTLSPDSGGMINIFTKSDVKTPELNKPISLYVDGKGMLTDEDPTQPQFPSMRAIKNTNDGTPVPVESN